MSFITSNHTPVHYKGWERVGIKKLNDIITLNGNFKTIQVLEQEYGITIDIMKYNGLKSAIPRSWLKYIKTEEPFEYKVNRLSITINKIEKDIEDLHCKDLYWLFIGKKCVKPTSIDKWEENYYYVDFDWHYLFTLPYKVARETKLQSLQYQILNRFFPCKHFLKMCQKEEVDTCNHCGHTETLEHYFFKCHTLRLFWNSFNHWFARVYGAQIQLHTPDILFGVPNPLSDPVIENLNFCILFAKNFINSMTKKSKDVQLDLYLTELKNRLDVERTLLDMSQKSDHFKAKWQELYDTLL